MISVLPSVVIRNARIILISLLGTVVVFNVAVCRLMGWSYRTKERRYDQPTLSIA